MEGLKEVINIGKDTVLRRRPAQVRYFYLAISVNRIHTGASYGGLVYAHKNHEVIHVILADIVSGRVASVEEPLKDFMRRWKDHYNDPDWDYFAEVEAKTNTARRRK